MVDEPRDVQEDEDSEALKKAMSFVVGRGLPLPKNWTGEELEKLEFPNDLTRLTIDQLGELLGVWTSVMAYAQYETARMDVERTAKQNRYEFEKRKAWIRTLNDPNFTSEKQREAEVYVRTAKLLQSAELARAVYTMTNAMLGAYSKYYQALSRELSRRGLEGAGQSVGGTSKEDNSWVQAGKDSLTKKWSGDAQSEEEE